MIAGLTGLSGLSGLVARGDVADRTPGLAARFRADDLIGVVADAAAVTTWPDATGNGNDVGNTGSNRPVFDEVNPQFNGHASVNFAKASSHYLFASSPPICADVDGTAAPWTAFLVVRRSTKVTANETPLSFGNSASAVHYQQLRYTFGSSNSQRPSFTLRDGAAAETNHQGLNEITDLGPQVLCCVRGATDGFVYVAGASQNPHYDAYIDAVPASGRSGDAYTSQGSFTLNRLCIGGLLRSTFASPSDLEVAEVLIYTRELAEAERVRVMGYLHNRYVAVNAGTIPTRIDLTVAHHWDCSATNDLPGERCTRVTNGSDVANDLVASGDARPTVRLDAASGLQYLEFDGAANVMNPEAATAANWTFLHSAASSYGVWMVVRVPSSAGSAYQPLLDTNGNSTTAQGIAVGADATSAAHSLQLKIGNGAANVLNHDSQDYGLRPDVWHVIHWTVEVGTPSTEERYQIWIDNENYAASNAANAADADAAVGSLLVGKLVGAATFGKFDLGEIFITNTKPGRPGESQLINEYLASKWKTSHVSLASGNGFANLLNDATPHRGFPGLLRTQSGIWILIYRRATTHGSSAGVAVMKTSGDGLRWSNERVIFDDATNYDWRGCNALKQISTGRIFLGMMLSETDSSLLPYTSAFMYSDDDGGSWSAPMFVSNETDAWFDGLGSDTGVEWDESPNALVELSNGKLIAHLSITVAGLVYPHICQIESADGGATWSEPQPIWFGRDTSLGGNFPQDERIQEPFSVLFADGEILLAIRADYVPVDNPTGRIYFARSTDGGATWTPEDFSTEFVEGYGNPRMIVDPNDPDGVWLFHRTGTTPNIAVYRYSDDRGVTWSDPEPVTNLNDGATTTIGDYGGMTYVFPHYDDDGNVWIAWGMEQSNDSDIFVRRWSNAE